jgi:thioredoxin-dependent peroxiredoxin
MKLIPGQTAPLFTIKDANDKTISLQDFSNKKLLLCFFRYAGCPFCNLQISKLIERYDNYAKRGLSIIAFFQSPQDTVLQYPGKQKPQFPLIPDPEKNIYTLYGVESSIAGLAGAVLHAPSMVEAMRFGQGKIDGDLFLMPATILINPNQTIYSTHYSTNLAEKLPLFDIEEFLLKA